MADGPLLGHTLTLEIGPPAHGGSCVARHEGRAVFVRHTLPGESVRALVTHDRGGSHCFADAIEVLRAAPERVAPPCPYAGPGRCGGCDWQHVTPAAQRDLKSIVVRDQFRRLARLELDDLFGAVEALPGGPLGWRTRNLYAVGPDGRAGLRRHASHQLEPIDTCLLGAPGVGDTTALHDRWPGLTGIEVARGSDTDTDTETETETETTLLAHRPGAGRQARGRRPPDRVRVVSGPPALRHHALGRDFTVAADGFWQVHPAALDTFAAALLDGVRPQPGETVLDLYAGAGALTAALAGAVGPSGQVLGLEASASAVADAAANLAGQRQAVVRRARVTADELGALDSRPDVVVLDPPRAGAGREVMEAVVALGARVVGYVSCDPSTLARDVATATALGWRLIGLRAFDAFPMTHHIECVAVLAPGHAP